MSKSLKTSGDHPRVRGEKDFEVTITRPMRGSPPRVRGEAAGLCQDFFKEGITPACAGRSITPPAAPGDRRDHPRVCGEKL